MRLRADNLSSLGFALGPLCWAPVSEIWGRRWGILPAMFFLGVSSIGTATSKNAASIFITRFLGGVFGSAPVSNVSAALADIWPPEARGSAVILYSIAVTGGPTLGPIIGAALLVNPSLGWRWTEYIEAIWAFTTFAVCFFALPESYSPVLLKRRAQNLRIKGVTDCYHPHERVKLDFRTVITKHFTRPLLMLVTEPMVTCIASYASFVYGILYLTLEVFPICFEEIRGMALVKASLPFLGLFIGVLAAVFINLANQPRYRQISAAAGGKPVPEARFAPVAFAGFVFVGGLFWFGWTAGDIYVSVWHPIVASGLIGAGFNVIFNQCVNVLVDTYGIYAASAVSANTFLRSFMAAGFPLVARPMLYQMGVGPAISVLGVIAGAMIVVPFLFMKYGSALRKRSKFAQI